MENTELKTLDELRSRLSYEDYEFILNEVCDNLPPMRLMHFYITVYKVYVKTYLFYSSLLMIVLIVNQSWPLYSFFFPLIPMVIIGGISLIEVNVLTFRMNKVHTTLIERGIRISWDELMDVVAYYLFANQENKDKPL